MTIDEIEGMSDEEYARLPAETRAEIAAILLESLVADGVAYKGEDGRYRMREDVTYMGDGVAVGRRPQ